MAYNKIHFKLIDDWKPRKKLIKSLPPRRTWCTPETLFSIAEFTLRKYYFNRLPKDLFWPAIFAQLRSNQIVGTCQYLMSSKRKHDVKFMIHWEKLTHLLDRTKNRYENKILVGNTKRRKNVSIVHPVFDGASDNVRPVVANIELCRLELNSQPLIL